MTFDLSAAFHASAPSGCKCADCTMGPQPCPTCYASWWYTQHPHTQLVGSSFERPDKDKTFEKRCMAVFNKQREAAIKYLEESGL